MQTKHAIAAGLGAPARLRPVIDPFSGSGGSALAKEKTAGHISTTAAIENQHLDFASLPNFTPVAGGATR